MNESEQLLEFLGKNGPDFTQPLPAIRIGFDRMTSALTPPEGYAPEQAVLGGVPVVVAGPQAGRDGGRVLFYLHGGGFLLGSAAGFSGLACRIAGTIKARAVIVDYSLSPEAKFPEARNQALAAYRALLEDGVSPQAIVVAGDSAGGGFSLSLLRAIRDAGLPMPAAAVLISPWLDLTLSSGSMDSKAEVDVVLTRAGLANMASAYLQGHDANDPAASPLLGDFAGFPPLQIHVGTNEVLLDDSLRGATRAAHHGVLVELRVWPGMIHDFPLFAQILTQGRNVIAAAGDFLGRFAN